MGQVTRTETRGSNTFTGDMLLDLKGRNTQVLVDPPSSCSSLRIVRSW